MSSEHFKSRQESRKTFPEWVRDPEYLPTLEELRRLYDDNLWDDFIHHNPHGNEFQILSKEFVDSFTNELLRAIEKIDKKSIAIVEVGAGNGRLAHFLGKAIAKQSGSKQISIKAVDDYSWDSQMLSTTPIFMKKIFAEEGTVQDSLEESPDVVISSWMPNGVDWTESFRENESVQLYVLIGKPDECGTPDSWKDTDDFEGDLVPLEGIISWSDWGPHSDNKKSLVGFFSRK